MKKLLLSCIHYIDKAARTISIAFIKLYQRTLSPDKGIPSLRLKGRVCHHEPHCSQYGILCLQRYNFFSSCRKIIERISKCTGGFGKKYDPAHYRVVFMSGAPIGVPFLEKFHKDKRFDVVGVITMPDQPSGRGMKVRPNIIKKTATKLRGHEKTGEALKDFQDQFIKTPHSLRLDSKKYGDQAHDVYQWLQEKKPDFIVTIAYGKIVRQHILDIPLIAPINVHGSLLPEYRGASPLQSVFLDKRTETGITIMKMDATLDTGDMIDKLAIPLPFSRTVRDLIDEIIQQGPKFLINTLQAYAQERLVDKKQDDSKATLCSKISKEDGEIDPYTQSIASIYAKYRAYALWPKTHFIAPKHRNNQDKTVILDTLVLDETLYQEYKKQPVFLDTNDTLNPCIVSLALQPEGKKAMNRNDFTNGYVLAKN